eukprot:6182266-Pleurochrysis_carterae.AAC.2
MFFSHPRIRRLELFAFSSILLISCLLHIIAATARDTNDKHYKPQSTKISSRPPFITSPFKQRREDNVPVVSMMVPELARPRTLSRRTRAVERREQRTERLGPAGVCTIVNTAGLSSAAHGAMPPKRQWQLDGCQLGASSFCCGTSITGSCETRLFKCRQQVSARASEDCFEGQKGEQAASHRARRLRELFCGQFAQRITRSRAESVVFNASSPSNAYACASMHQPHPPQAAHHREAPSPPLLRGLDGRLYGGGHSGPQARSDHEPVAAHVENLYSHAVQLRAPQGLAQGAIVGAAQARAVSAEACRCPGRSLAAYQPLEAWARVRSVAYIRKGCTAGGVCTCTFNGVWERSARVQGADSPPRNADADFEVLCPEHGRQ